MKTIYKYDNLKVPAYALPYLVNGDDSGLTTDDKKTIDQWFNGFSNVVNKDESLIFSVDDMEQDEYFTWHPAFGLACSVMDCTILIVAP